MVLNNRDRKRKSRMLGYRVMNRDWKGEGKRRVLEFMVLWIGITWSQIIWRWDYGVMDHLEMEIWTANTQARDAFWMVPITIPITIRWMEFLLERWLEIGNGNLGYSSPMILLREVYVICAH